MNDHIVKNIIKLGPNSVSLESIKNIACVGQNTNKFEQNEIYSKLLQKIWGPIRASWFFRKKIGEKKVPTQKMRPNLGFLVI